MPGYEGRVAFIDALTTDPSAAPVLDRYPTQYIPTSVFVTGTGDVAEVYIGPLDDDALRERLDQLTE